MFDFHEKRKVRGVLYSRPVAFLLFLLTIFLSVSAFNRYTIARDMRERLEIKEEELNEMKQRAQAIESKVKYMEDERGIEEELRNRFDAIREGEQVIILLDQPPKSDEEKKATSQSDGGTTTKEETSFFGKMKFW